MGFTIYNMFKAGLCVTNAVAILHPKRFLAKYGYDRVDAVDPYSGGGGGGGGALKAQIVGLLLAVGYLKVPLVAVNILVILIEVVAGG